MQTHPAQRMRREASRERHHSAKSSQSKVQGMKKASGVLEQGGGDTRGWNRFQDTILGRNMGRFQAGTTLQYG